VATASIGAISRHFTDIAIILFFDPFSLREPVATSLENAMSQQSVDGLLAALEIGVRSSYVPDAPIGVRSRFPGMLARTRRSTSVRKLQRLELPIWMK
jgi:hypothetical protein